MAGLGRKVFNAGEVLSAANVQGYLQDQVVQVYSGTAARSSAIGTAVSEGMASYRTDDNVLEVYTTAGTVSAWSPVDLSQSPNAILNADFAINQRAFSSSTSSTYGFDRWVNNTDGVGATFTAQTFTPGSAPVAGYEGKNFLQVATTGQTVAGTFTIFGQRIEDVRSFSGQSVTISFWAKAASGTPKIGVELFQYFSGGSSDVSVPGGAVTLSTSWVRYSATVAVPSMSGKTIGAGGGYLELNLWTSAGSTFSASRASSIGIQTATIAIWGVQVEAGSVATPFRRNAPSLQGELAACQRYYVRFSGTSSYNNIGLASALNSTTGGANFQFPVQMRTTPTSLDSGGTLYTSQYIGVSQTITAISYRSDSSPYQGVANFSVSSGLNTSYRYDVVTANTGAGNYVGFSAEL